ncbi:tyrosine-type recombinase/integrase [Erwiniaceae bacterium L1_54_6]|jgi:integrase|nr:tyrosine-type recombinase/integrase [Erwiniaceae bacterium L1_54_6]
MRTVLVVPLLDYAYVRALRRYLATFCPRPRRPLFFATLNTALTWLRQAEERAQTQGIGFAISPLSPKTFRHSYAMHLFFNHVPPKVVKTRMGHDRYESTEVYL